MSDELKEYESFRRLIDQEGRWYTKSRMMWLSHPLATAIACAMFFVAGSVAAQRAFLASAIVVLLAGFIGALAWLSTYLAGVFTGRIVSVLDKDVMRRVK